MNLLLVVLTADGYGGYGSGSGGGSGSGDGSGDGLSDEFSFIHSTERPMVVTRRPPANTPNPREVLNTAVSHLRPTLTGLVVTLVTLTVLRIC